MTLTAERPITAAAPLTTSEGNELIATVAASEKTPRIAGAVGTQVRAWTTTGDVD